MANIFDLIEEDKAEKINAFKMIGQARLDAEAARMKAKGEAEAAKMAAYDAEHGIDPEEIEEEEDEEGEE